MSRQNNKRSILNFLVHNRIMLTVLFFIIIIGSPCIIWVMYYIGDYSIGIPTHFTAGDLLIYAGTILTFGGTFFLGYLALIQNIDLKDMQQEIKNIQNHQYNIDNCVIINISAILLNNENSININSGTFNKFSFSMCNHSDIPLFEIEIYDSNRQFEVKRPLTLFPGERKNYTLYNLIYPIKISENINDIYEVHFVFSSIQGIKTQAKLVLKKEGNVFDLVEYIFFGLLE